jgi:hypothetical protein
MRARWNRYLQNLGVQNTRLRYFSSGPILSVTAIVVPREGELKWLGRLQKSSKCRLAWKSTCTPVRRANKRSRQLRISAEVTAGCDNAPDLGLFATSAAASEIF